MMEIIHNSTNIDLDRLYDLLANILIEVEAEESSIDTEKSA